MSKSMVVIGQEIHVPNAPEQSKNDLAGLLGMMLVMVIGFVVFCYAVEKHYFGKIR